MILAYTQNWYGHWFCTRCAHEAGDLAGVAAHLAVQHDVRAFILDVDNRCIQQAEPEQVAALEQRRYRYQQAREKAREDRFSAQIEEAHRRSVNAKRNAQARKGGEPDNP